LVVKPRDGMMTNVRLADEVHVFTLKKASLADVKQGGVVGITTSQQMDGSQKGVEVYIFPDPPTRNASGFADWSAAARHPLRTDRHLARRSILDGAVGKRAPGMADTMFCV